MRRLAWLLFLLALLAGCRSTPATGATQQRTVKVVTLNLYHDKDDWPRRRVQIARELEELQPDVVALQEVIQHETVENQAAWLARQLGYEWHFVSVDPDDRVRRYGNALLTRHRILQRGGQHLQPFDDSRTVGFLRIDLGGLALNVYATHLHWTDQGGAIRARQVADLTRYVAATSGGIPSIVAGDFNSTADAPELAALREGFVDAYGHLHPGADPVSSSTLNPRYFAPKRIDHVFYQRGVLEPVSAEVILDRPDAHGVSASDHHGVLAVLRVARSRGE